MSTTTTPPLPDGTEDIQTIQSQWAAAQALQGQPGSPGFDTATWNQAVWDDPPPNGSNTGGYIVPTLSSTVEDQALLRVVQQAIAGISGLPFANVRPRYQNVPPPQLGRNVNWASLGIRSRDNIDYPQIVHNPNAYNGKGGDILTFQESIVFLVIFYGPGADGYATLFRDGCYMRQNLEAIRQYGLALYGVKHAVNTTELVNRQYIGRSDVIFLLRREVKRLYPVFNFVQAVGQVQTTIDNVDSGVITQPTLPLVNPPTTPPTNPVTSDQAAELLVSPSTGDY